MNMVKTALKSREAFLELLIMRGYDRLGEFSDKANIGYATLQQVTSGKRNPTPRTAFKIAAALGMDFHDLFVFQHRGAPLDGGKEET